MSGHKAHWLWWVAAGLAAIIGGGWRLVSARHRVIERSQFAIDFLTRFQQWVRSQGQDTATYVWLIQRSGRMQTQLGSGGILHHFKPAFAQIMYPRYPIVLNLLPELRRRVDDLDMFSSHQFNDYASTLQEAIARHIGDLEDEHHQLIRDLRNPLAWIRAAVQFVLLLPLYLLEWSGLDRYPVVRRAITSWPAKLASVLAVLASLVTILAGWDQVRAVISRWHR